MPEQGVAARASPTAAQTSVSARPGHRLDAELWRGCGSQGKMSAAELVDVRRELKDVKKEIKEADAAVKAWLARAEEIPASVFRDNNDSYFVELRQLREKESQLARRKDNFARRKVNFARRKNNFARRRKTVARRRLE